MVGELHSGPADERRWFDALLGEGISRASARAKLSADRESRETLHGLESALERARHECLDVPAWSRQSEQELVRRILAATTRRPAVRRSLARTRTAAAAVLLLGLAVWAVRHRTITAAPSSGTSAAVALASLNPLSGGFPQVLKQARADLTTTATAARVGARWEPLTENAPIEVRLLEARAQGLRERRWASWLQELPVTDLRPLALALWCEVELDRFVLTGEKPPAWNHVVDILERSRGAARDSREGRLLAHALGRAVAYRMTRDAKASSSDAGVDPWSPEWFADLEAAGLQAGLADAQHWREWVSWRGRKP